MSSSAEKIEPGDIRTRDQIREVFGGSGQGGICASIEKKSVNLYSDPSVGEANGYYDGWLAEEDELGRVFEYTGAGKSGDQTLDQTGNRAILGHVQKNRVIRVFKQVGKVPGSDTKTHRYLGAFRLDPVRPYEWRRVHDVDKNDRDVIVFRLRPEGVGQIFENEEIPAAEETVAKFAELKEVTAASLQDEPITSGELSISEKKTRKNGHLKGAIPHRENDGKFVESEEFRTHISFRNPSSSTVATRRKAALKKAYKDFLDGAGHKTGEMQIKVKGLTSTFRTDLYDVTDNTLYAVKGASFREDVRSGLGQLLDFSHLIKSAKGQKAPNCILLLPSPPPPDMYELLDQYNIGVVYQSDDGSFVGDVRR
ncbi:hypothetical protein [Nocardiopsis dassonvillei]|uniref:hypothetical protein n=1 Tax=Nocardiopsis dassonvillei TaxID=2014 RepID=UPI00157CDC22|nr:hypothetical protein [Nocardiopsis dassonvillei]